MAEVIERAVQEETEETSPPLTNRHFYIIIAVILIIFLSFFGYKYFLLSQGPLTIEDLHDLNIKCNLPSGRGFLTSISCWWKSLPPERGYVHNGYSFVLSDGIWYTKISSGEKDYQIPLHFGPREVVNITISGSVNGSFDEGFEMYITVDPTSDGQDYIALAASELAQNIATAIQRRPIGACDRNETAMCEFRPIVACDTTDKAMVYLVHGPGPSVEMNGRCIIAKGQGYDLVKAADRILLHWYKIQ